MKKSISLLLALLMLLSLLPSGVIMVTAASAGDFDYEIVNNTAVLTGYFGDATTVTVPDELGGHPVTAIGNNAFLGRHWIQYLTLPDSITAIGNDAFRQCRTLVRTNWPKSLVSIGNNAFQDCFNLRDIQLPDGLKTIGDEAFEYCSSRYIGNVVLPTSLKSVGKDAFANCFDLKMVIFNGTSKQWKAVDVADKAASAAWLECVVCKKDTPAVSASVVSNGVKVTWKPMYGACCYNVYQRIYSGGKWRGWNLYDVVMAGDCSSIDTGAKSGVKTQYAVRVIYDEWDGDLGISGSVFRLDAPKATVANASKGINVSWNKVTGAKKYEIYRRLGSGKWLKIKTTASTSYTDTKAKTGKTYTYRVKAINGSYASKYKTTASICRMKASSSIKLTKTSSGFKITWSKVTGAKKYEIYRRTGSGSWKKIKTTTSRSYMDKTAKKGKYYTYRVRAVSGSSKSLFKTGKKTKR